MRGKTKKFEDNKENPFIIEEGKKFYKDCKGHWIDYFQNRHPLILEIGCGRGEYTIGLAQQNPETNYIGIDYQGERLWYGANTAREESLLNVAFLRARAENLHDFFRQGTISEIWLTFPGPHPKTAHAHRRLTNNTFLDLYKTLLTEDGIMHLKTDSDSLIAFTKEELNKRSDIVMVTDLADVKEEHFSAHPALEIPTEFERKFRVDGVPIKYLAWQYQA